MTLTEQLKNKQLEWHKSYYCQNKKGDVCIAIFMNDGALYSQELGGNLNFDYWEVIAPVPSYQEYLESESHCAVYSEVNKWLKEENQQLKELLRECHSGFRKLPIYNLVGEDEAREVNKLLNKIDNAIGEKK